MKRDWEFLEWIRLSIRHREEELELLHRMEADAYRSMAEDGPAEPPVHPDWVADRAAAREQDEVPRREPAPGTSSGGPSTDQPFDPIVVTPPDSGNPASTYSALPDPHDSRDRPPTTPAAETLPDAQIRGSSFPQVPRPIGEGLSEEVAGPPDFQSESGAGPPAPSAVTPTPAEHAGREAMAIQARFEETVVSEVPAADRLAPEVTPPEVPAPEVPAPKAPSHGHAAGFADFDAPTDSAPSPPDADEAIASDPPPIEEPGPESAPEPTVGAVLLMEEQGRWISFPWHEVDRVALTDEIPLAPGDRFRFSLHSLFADESEGAESPARPSPQSEPFAILWRREHGLSILCCRRFGGITTAKEAFDRGVEWMVRPPLPGEGRQPQIVKVEHAVGSPVPAPPAVSEPSAVPPSSPAHTSGAPDRPWPPPEAVSETPATGPDAGPGSRVSSESQAASPGTSPEAEPEGRPEQTNGEPRRRVLLAVPYLPARVALSRSFRRAHWEVTEEVDPAGIREELATTGYDAVFLDLADSPDPELLELLEADRLADLSVIAIGSRFQRPHERATGRLALAPRLHFPFQDDDVSRVVESLSKP